MKYKKDEDLPVIQFEKETQDQRHERWFLYIMGILFAIGLIGGFLNDFKIASAFGTIVESSATSPVTVGDLVYTATTYADYEVGTELSSNFLMNGVYSECELLTTDPKYANGVIDTTGMTAGTYSVTFRTYESTSCTSTYDIFSVASVIVEDVPIPEITTKQFNGLLFSSMFISSLLVLILGSLIMITKELR